MSLLDIKTRGELRDPYRSVVTDAPPSILQAIAKLPGARVQKDDSVTFPPEPLLVHDLIGIDPNLKYTPAAQVWIQAHDGFEAQSQWLKTAKVEGNTDWWSKVLYPYQKTGALWLRFANRAILGDEMGLGKTLQALAAASTNTRRIKHPAVLIVTPSIAKRPVWETHIQHYLPDEQLFVCDSTSTKRARTLEEFAVTGQGYVVINHEMLQQRVAGKYEALYTTKWNTVILDEAHKFQNHQSSWSKGAQALRADNMYLLTGTPVWNSPEDIFGLLHIIDPLRWSSYWEWVEEFCTFEVTPWARTITGIRMDKLPKFLASIAPVFIRREAEEVLRDLPKRRVQTITYELSRDLRKAYNVLHREFVVITPDDKIIQFEPSVSKMFSDMRAMLNAPSLLGLNYESDKNNAIQELLEQALSDPAHKVVVFTWHRNYANYLRNWLDYEKLAVEVITGETPDSSRDRIITDFQHPEGHTRVLIASIALASVAIDLTAANVAIFAEGDYVPTNISQAEKRLHRIGQKLDVMIYRLAARGTLEEAVWATVDSRQGLSDQMTAFSSVVQHMKAQEEINE